MLILFITFRVYHIQQLKLLFLWHVAIIIILHTIYACYGRALLWNHRLLHSLITVAVGLPVGYVWGVANRIPTGTRRNNNVITTSKRRRFDVVMTLFLRFVSLGWFYSLYSKHRLEEASAVMYSGLLWPLSISTVFRRPLTVPLPSLNNRQMHAVIAVQEDCGRVWWKRVWCET